MESRSEASFNVGLQKSPSSSLFPAAQQTPLVFGDLPSSQGLSVNTGERVKRKRGRPRKYAGPDGSMAHGILASPSSISATPLQMAGSSSGFTLSSSVARLESQKKKGKLQSSGKKLQMNALGSSGIGFTPHVITVKVGEDVSAKIMSFSNHGPRAVCILSANGAISNVTLRQASASSGTITYEGRFEILSLSGSFLVSESSDQCSRTGGLSVSLAGPDGHVLGGGVAGALVAATPVQVIVGSFIADTASKEPVAIIPSFSAVESGLGRFTPSGLPGPSSPISRGPLSPSPIFSPPHNQNSNGNNHSGNNSQCLPVMPWN